MKLSVAMCTYNGGRFLEAQLDSILSQKISVDEIIVCDDCSGDNTKQILESYKLKFPAIFVIYHNEKRLGILKNFEKAINYCTGDIIFLSDQDDIWLEGKTEAYLHVFRERPEVNLIFSDANLIDKDSNIIDDGIWKAWKFTAGVFELAKQKSLLFYLLINGNVATGATFALRTSWIQPCVLIPSQKSLAGNSVVFHDEVILLNAVLYDEKSVIILHDKHMYYRKHDLQNAGVHYSTFNEAQELERQKMLLFDGEPSALHKVHKYSMVLKKVQSNMSLRNTNYELAFADKLLLVKKEYLASFSIVVKKLILFYWYFRSFYFTTFKEVVLL